MENFSIVGLLDSKLSADQESSKDDKKYYPLRPSSAGKCSRRLGHELEAFLGKAQAKHETRKPHVLRLLNLGHSIEWNVLRLLASIDSVVVGNKQQVVTLFTLPSGRLIDGSIDCTVVSGNYRAILDVKSVGDKYSSYTSGKWDDMLYTYGKLRSMRSIGQDSFYIDDITEAFIDLGEDSLVDNIKQVNSYLGSQFAKERGFEHGCILRYNKNNSRMMEIHFKYSPYEFEQLRKKYGAIETAVKGSRTTSIKKDFALGSMACAYCPYQKDCYPAATKKEIYANAPSKNWATRVGDLEGAATIRELFAPYLASKSMESGFKAMEQAIIVELNSHDVDRVKLDDGTVWEVKTLQSPKPHQELRRSKE